MSSAERHRPAVAHQRDDPVGGTPSSDSSPNSLLDPQSFLPPTLPAILFIIVNFKILCNFKIKGDIEVVRFELIYITRLTLSGLAASCYLYFLTN